MRLYLKGQVPKSADPQEWADALLDHVLRIYGTEDCGPIVRGMLVEWFEAAIETAQSITRRQK